MVQLYLSRLSRHAILFVLVIVIFPNVHLRPSGDGSVKNANAGEYIADAGLKDDGLSHGKQQPSQNGDKNRAPLQEQPEVPRQAAPPAIEEDKNVPAPPLEKQPDPQQQQQQPPPPPKEEDKPPSQNGDNNGAPLQEQPEVPRQAAPPAIEEDKNLPAPEKQGKKGLQQQKEEENESLEQQVQPKQRQEEEQRREQEEKEPLKKQAEQNQRREEAGEKKSPDDEAQQPAQQEVIATLWHFPIETYLLFIGLVLLTLCCWKQCWHLIFRLVGYRDGYQSQGGKAYAYSVLHNSS